MSTYNLDRPQKGLALIINNLDSEQEGTKKDVENLQKMFQKINIETEEVKTDQTADQLQNICNDLKNKNLEAYNMFFLVVISHGEKGDLINCGDPNLFDIQVFVNCLKKHKDLIGYPKLLIFDFCRGSAFNCGEAKLEDPCTRIPLGSDVFLGFATTKGYVSITRKDGSPFINALCSSVEELFHKKTFNHIFQEVQREVSKQITSIIHKKSYWEAMQIPESCSTLTNHLYLMDAGKNIFLTTG